MRVSTSQLFQQGISNILKQQTQLLSTQSQISSGKRISQPSDDPIASAQTQLIRQQLSFAERFQTNINTARNHAEEQESILSSMIGSTQRVRELYIQVNSGALDDTARRGITNELRGILDQLVGFANYQDKTGRYMFSGYQTSTVPVTTDASGDFQYNGDDGQQFLQISSAIQIPVSDSGTSVFANVRAGNGVFSISDPGATNTGSGVISPGNIVNPAAYVVDDYTLSFADVGGTMTYTVVDSSAATVATGTYQEGASITFRGMSVEVSDDPADGDDFLIEPSKGILFFNSIKTVVDKLDNLQDTASDQAALQNTLNQGLEELDQALSNLNVVRTSVGSRMNTIESAELINEDFKLHSQTLLSSLEDVDLAEASLRLNAQATALQAAQQSFIRIQNLSVFNFL